MVVRAFQGVRSWIEGTQRTSLFRLASHLHRDQCCLSPLFLGAYLLTLRF